MIRDISQNPSRYIVLQTKENQRLPPPFDTVSRKVASLSSPPQMYMKSPIVVKHPHQERKKKNPKSLSNPKKRRRREKKTVVTS